MTKIIVMLGIILTFAMNVFAQRPLKYEGLKKRYKIDSKINLKITATQHLSYRVSAFVFNERSQVWEEAWENIQYHHIAKYKTFALPKDSSKIILWNPRLVEGTKLSKGKYKFKIEWATPSASFTEDKAYFTEEFKLE